MFNAFNFRHSSKDFDHKTKFIKKKRRNFFLLGSWAMRSQGILAHIEVPIQSVKPHVPI
jgi:hypothetical protein